MLPFPGKKEKIKEEKKRKEERGDRRKETKIFSVLVQLLLLHHFKQFKMIIIIEEAGVNFQSKRKTAPSSGSKALFTTILMHYRKKLLSRYVQNGLLKIV